MHHNRDAPVILDEFCGAMQSSVKLVAQTTELLRSIIGVEKGISHYSTDYANSRWGDVILSIGLFSS